MKGRKGCCKHCGSTSKRVKLYWCSRNLLKTPLKTYYCKGCARIVVPGIEPILESKELA